MTNIWKTISRVSGDDTFVTPTNKRGIPVNIPGRQISRDSNTSDIVNLKNRLGFLKPGYQFEVIPLIRKIKDANPDVSQAFKDVIQLANTGHKIKFDPSVPHETQRKMQEDINEAAKTWVEGAPGIHGIINKMFSQLLVSGAISNEWVPNMELTSIDRLKFLHPEKIRWAKRKGNSKYIPYQLVDSDIIAKGVAGLIDGQYIKLNQATFKYFTLLGDAESPYGIPPYLSAITGLSTQNRMLENIDNIVSMMGILGWAEALMEKPDMMDSESESAYIARLNNTLKELKTRVEGQLRDGVSVGFKDEHEFNFQQTVKSAEGVDSLWAHNEQQIASALDFDPAFMGRSYNTSETMITILFIKMVSQLTNIQNVVEYNLTYGLDLFLRLKGYNFKYIKVEFNKSTITDDLKYQQALEIKARVLLQHYLMGTIDSEGYAKEFGFDAPASKSPLVDPSVLAGKGQVQKDKEDREKDKDKSERDTRQKRKQGEVRKTKPQTSN